MDDLMQPVAWMYVNDDDECEQIEYGEPFDDPSVTHLYTADQMREYAKKAVEAERERCLKCYSPDDTATDWADKIRGLPLD